MSVCPFPAPYGESLSEGQNACHRVYLEAAGLPPIMHSRCLGSVSLGWVVHASMLLASETLEPPMETWGFCFLSGCHLCPHHFSPWLLHQSAWAPCCLPLAFAHSAPEGTFQPTHCESTVLFWEMASHLQDWSHSSSRPSSGPCFPHLCSGDHVRVLISKCLLLGEST